MGGGRNTERETGYREKTDKEMREEKIIELKYEMARLQAKGDRDGVAAVQRYIWRLQDGTDY